MDLDYCNRPKRYDVSTNQRVRYLDCDPKNYNISDLSPKAFRRGYIAALFTEDERWLTTIEKYHMVVPGSPKNSRDKARDLATKEKLREQVRADTYEDRKRFYQALMEAPCCADDCGQYCEECSNKEIKFKSTPNFGLDSDVRRFITKYGRYQTVSELEREENDRSIFSGVRDRKSDNDAFRVRGKKGDGLFGQPKEVSSDQAERVKALLSYPISEEMVT